LAEVAGSSPAAAERRRQRGACLDIQLPAVRGRVWSSQGRVENQTAGALSGQALRSQHRSEPRLAKFARGAKTGKMGQQQERGKIRETCKNGRNIRPVHSTTASTIPKVRASCRGDRVGPKAPSFRATTGLAEKGRYVADLFSGHGGVARAVRAAGFTAREWELLHGSHGDLTSPLVRKTIKEDCKRHRVIAAMLAPPCSSFSPARYRTSVIRSRKFPWGLPGIPDHEQVKVDIGNKCFLATFDLIRCFNQHGIPWILENPHASKCWYLPQLDKLLHSANCHVVVADFCQFGTKWRKRTRFLCGNIDPLDLQRVNLKCSGHGWCSATNKPHFQLTGSNNKGIPWTRIAQPYPTKLCHALAHALTSGTRLMTSVISRVQAMKD
jgi:hypothetical protein